jgi:hypothetical protein
MIRIRAETNKTRKFREVSLQPTRLELVINLKTAKGDRPYDPRSIPAARGSGDW